MRRSKLSPIQIRLQQIDKELQKLRTESATKTRQNWKTEEGYQDWKKRLPEKISRLEEEISILSYPGEYAEIPLAVIAEELGLSLADVQILIKRLELTPSDDYKDRITREELEKAVEIGPKELMRRAGRTADEIFIDAIQCLEKGDVGSAEEYLDFFKDRDGYEQWDVLEMIIGFAKGNYQDAIRNFQFMLTGNLESRARSLSYVSRALKVLKPKTYEGRVIVEQMLAIAEGANDEPYHLRTGGESRVIGKHLDQTQQRAMYLGKAVANSLSRYRHVQSFKSYHDRTSQMRQEEFERVVRDAIYTALHAEETYTESDASKLYTDSINALIPQWWAPASLMEILPRKKP